MTPFANLLRSARPGRSTLLRTAAVLYVEGMLTAGYVLFAPVRITDPLVLLYPWVWINVGLLAVAGTTVTPSPTRRRRAAIALGVAYFVVLAAVGGLATLGHTFHGHGHVFGPRIAWPLPPGWGPMVIYGGEWVGLAVVPYKVVGYASLAYLVYATVLDAAGSALAGAVGLFSCVSCAWPVVGTVLTSLLGSSSAVATAAANQPYGTSTLVFLSAVGLLYYRPLLHDRSRGA